MSSKRHQRVRGCAGKIRHADQTAAMAARKSLARKAQVSLSGIRAYRCMACGSWHVGRARRFREYRS